MKVYLFKPAKSKVVHAVVTEHASMGTFEQDRIFGGGFTIPCGRSASGPGTLSEVPKPPAYVSCKKCRGKLWLRGKVKVWKCTTRKLDKPRVLGVPG